MNAKMVVILMAAIISATVYAQGQDDIVIAQELKKIIVDNPAFVNDAIGVTIKKHGPAIVDQLSPAQKNRAKTMLMAAADVLAIDWQAVEEERTKRYRDTVSEYESASEQRKKKYEELQQKMKTEAKNMAPVGAQAAEVLEVIHGGGDAFNEFIKKNPQITINVEEYKKYKDALDAVDKKYETENEKIWKRREVRRGPLEIAADEKMTKFEQVAGGFNQAITTQTMSWPDFEKFLRKIGKSFVDAALEVLSESKK